MSAAFKKKKRKEKWYSNKRDRDWPEKKDLGIHTSGWKSWARVASWTHKRKRDHRTPEAEDMCTRATLFNSGEQSVTITEILWKRHEWKFPSMLLI